METLVFLFSFSALGILYAMNTIPEFQEPYVILATGVAVLVIVFLFYFIITRGNPPKDFLFFGYVHTYRSNYASRLAKAFPMNKPLQLMPWVTLVGLKRVFAVFSFTCVIDLISALEHDGIVSGFMEFYQKTGEPYLGSAYSIMMCYWDGIVHFIMYLVMISRITDRKAYRTPGLFWAGSLCANMSVFIVGIVAGKYGSEIHPAFWLNFLFLLMPVLGAITLFSRPKDRPLIGGYTATHAQSMKLIWRPTDLVLILLLIAAMAFTILRGLVALDSPIEVCSSYLKHYEPYLKDPVGYPRITMLHLLFYGLPLLGASVYGLLKPGCTWMSDWTLFLAGGMMQCQWAHIGGSLHHRTTAPFRIPNECFWLVLAANLVYAATPVLVAMRVNGNPHFFLKISPFPGQTGLPISEEKDTKYKDK